MTLNVIQLVYRTVNKTIIPFLNFTEKCSAFLQIDQKNVYNPPSMFYFDRKMSYFDRIILIVGAAYYRFLNFDSRKVDLLIYDMNIV